MPRFHNKIVLISGGARGQGAAEARMLAAEGAKVVIADVLDGKGEAFGQRARRVCGVRASKRP